MTRTASGGSATRVIVLQPLGDLGPRTAAILESLRAYTAAFFVCDARVAEPLALPGGAFHADRGQYDGGRVLEFLCEHRPDDAVVYAGITDVDLFRSDLNFVFGLGSPTDGVGVYSLRRFDRAGVDDPRFLRLSLKILNHEIGHVFGLMHCVYYACSLGSANSLAEIGQSPLHYCPMCLRKLQWNRGLEVVPRYRTLAAFLSERGLTEEATWIEARLAHLAATAQAGPWR